MGTSCSSFKRGPLKIVAFRRTLKHVWNPEVDKTKRLILKMELDSMEVYLLKHSKESNTLQNHSVPAYLQVDERRGPPRSFLYPLKTRCVHTTCVQVLQKVYI